MDTQQAQRPSLPPPDWYADPRGRHQYRYFDGAHWTDQVSDNGSLGLDDYEAQVAVEPPAAQPVWAQVGGTRPATSTGATAEGEQDDELAVARKRLRGWGIWAVIIAVPSFFFIDIVSDGVMAGLLLATFLCIGTGIWLRVKPSTVIGVATGSSVVLLGIFDVGAASQMGGGFFPVIDFIFALGVFLATANYAKTTRALEHGSATAHRGSY